MKSKYQTSARSFACSLLAMGLMATVFTTADAQPVNSVLSTGANIGLERAGPIDPKNGFPQWYQDKTGLALELMVPLSAAELAGGYTVLLPDAPGAPGAIFPEVFPSNWFVEHFYFMARNIMDVPVFAGAGAQTGRCTISCAQEGSFSRGFTAAGDQIAFTRIRIDWRGVPYDGDYIIETPYSTSTFTTLRAGDRIFNTEDVGLSAAPAGFALALRSKVGPYLAASDIPGGAELPPITFEGRSYLADPIALTKVTGSPLGANRNACRIWYVGPAVGNVTPAPVLLCESTDFNLFGRIKTGPLPSKTEIIRASRTFQTTDKRVDVCAIGQSTLASRLVGQPFSVGTVPTLTAYMAPPVNTNGVLSAPAVAGVPMSKSGTQFSIQSPQYTTRAQIPTAVTVTDAQGGVFTSPVNDSIVIGSTVYNYTTKALTVTASSSDSGAALTIGTVDGPLTTTLKSGVYTSSAIPFAPCDIIVRSSLGGINSAETVTTKK